MSGETKETLDELIARIGSRMVPLKDVLDACVGAYDLGDWNRYMPWRFGNLCTPEECRELDYALHTRGETVA